MIELLLLYNEKVQFTFEGEHFLQFDGVATDITLGPISANVYTSYVENITSEFNHKLTLYRIHMDDILVTCDKVFVAI